MNLYKILVQHQAPAGWTMALVCLLIAENDEQVFDFIASDPSTTHHNIVSGWKNLATNESWEKTMGEEWDDEDYPNFREKTIALNGDMDQELSTSYHYGVTTYGWQLLDAGGNYDYLAPLFDTIVFKTA